MESIIEINPTEQQMITRWKDNEPAWEKLIQANGDLDELARSSGALIRKRKIKGAMVLLRLIMAYAVCDLPLRLVGAWATLLGIANLSDVALLYRFRGCQEWLGLLIVRVLLERSMAVEMLQGVLLRLMDATVISKPGSTGTDWRLHLSFNLGQLRMDGMELTDRHSGETLARFPAQKDEIRVGDRGYCYASSLGPLLAAMIWFVVRANWHNLPFYTLDGHKLDVIAWLKSLRQTTECQVTIRTSCGQFALRLIVCPLPAAQAQLARERVVRRAAKKGKKVSQGTYVAAGFLMLLTNLPLETWEVSRVVWLYRLRWQVELQFKRLKGILQFDHLRAQDPRLVQCYLLAKLLGALLLEQLLQPIENEQTDWFQPARPASLTRLTRLISMAIHHLILGHIPLHWSDDPDRLGLLTRYFCEPPRNRTQQLARARQVLFRLSVA
jgi:hypothetical protein